MKAMSTSIFSIAALATALTFATANTAMAQEKSCCAKPGLKQQATKAKR